ncbi:MULTISPECIES: GtrA family protein [Amycolatopsis]|uniref:GtrA family protein n=2 Tax=Amycolatopsis TaxID=1813 RepID=A0ABP9QZF4_9PSEU|nr:GtrA family protein [Amycolatopsis sacchari]SFI64406.1 Putative flippase GtrA (transmembrane translocase of bactoprenol-linked glucose) [Amycolatopsis sacchari]
MTWSRLVRFGLVGVLNTATYYVLYLLLHRFLPYLAAHVCAFLISMVGSYFLNCAFTFRTRPTLRKFLLFPLSNVTNLVVSSAGLYLLVDVLHWNQVVSPLVAAALAVPVTFVVAKLVLVGREHEGSGRARRELEGNAP